MIGALSLGEAFALGLASGPVCVASCGPVLVPSLLAEHSGLSFQSRFLSLFLATRLLGYLLFAAIAWELGSLLSLSAAAHSRLFGIIHLLLAAALLLYAHSVGRRCPTSCASSLVTIGEPAHRGVPAIALLGFLTGISLCPPFVAAGLRAAELGNIVAALLFFVAFFVGTSLWFIPFVGAGWLPRNEAIVTVARMTMVLVALFYGFMGLALLLGRKAYGY